MKIHMFVKSQCYRDNPVPTDAPWSPWIVPLHDSSMIQPSFFELPNISIFPPFFIGEIMWKSPSPPDFPRIWPQQIPQLFPGPKSRAHSPHLRWSGRSGSRWSLPPPQPPGRCSPETVNGKPWWSHQTWKQNPWNVDIWLIYDRSPQTKTPPIVKHGWKHVDLGGWMGLRENISRKSWFWPCIFQGFLPKIPSSNSGTQRWIYDETIIRVLKVSGSKPNFKTKPSDHIIGFRTLKLPPGSLQ